MLGVATLLLTLLVACVFSRRFFFGPADWLVAVGSALLLGLCVFGHFGWLLWMIGFAAWRSRPREHFADTEAVTTRTALVMPVYHEDVARVEAGIRATWLSVKQEGLAGHCDFFLLSDSTNPAIQKEEDEAARRLQSLFDGPGQKLFLLRRAERANYKAGNIANFLRQHGAGYDFMVVLDADSVMLGSRIRQLILKMQRRPRTAIIQSLMSAFRGGTPFGQAMQYSVSALSAIFSCGFAWFLGREALYWGHNAIIRIQPFAAHAQLPIFPGKPPLGGRVLSQDVHEAALLGRAGWDVELDLEPGGSFEELPANVISYGKRDQRWCTGDFLNSALILAPGFKTGQRVWLAYAMTSYAFSLVLVGMMLTGFALFPRAGDWAFDAVTLWWALVYMPVMQLGAKTLLFFMHLDRSRSVPRQALSLLCDILMGLLLTPLLVYQHVTFVLGILLGHPVQWTSPSRNPNDSISWALAARVFWVPTIIAACWIPAACALAPGFLFFSGTILFPWLFSIPLAVISSSPRLGRRLAATGLFACRRTPEELGVLRDLAAGTSDAYWFNGEGKKRQRLGAARPCRSG